MLSVTMLTACSDDDDNANGLGSLTPDEQAFGKATGNFTAEEWYPGGQLGTTEKASYSAPQTVPRGMAQYLRKYCTQGFSSVRALASP